jgi:hypothetical protein
MRPNKSSQFAISEFRIGSRRLTFALCFDHINFGKNKVTMVVSGDTVALKAHFGEFVDKETQ